MTGTSELDSRSECHPDSPHSVPTRRAPAKKLIHLYIILMAAPAEHSRPTTELSNVDLYDGLVVPTVIDAFRNNPNIVIAGGYALHHASYGEVSYGDIDVYSINQSWDDFKAFISRIHDLYLAETKPVYHKDGTITTQPAYKVVLTVSPAAINMYVHHHATFLTLVRKLQFIRYTNNTTPESIINEFDIPVCKCAIYQGELILSSNDDIRTYIATRTIPVASITRSSLSGVLHRTRIAKYISKGFTFTGAEDPNLVSFIQTNMNYFLTNTYSNDQPSDKNIVLETPTPETNVTIDEMMALPELTLPLSGIDANAAGATARVAAGAAGAADAAASGAP